jgi:signal recognition particle subunit SRP54
MFEGLQEKFQDVFRRLKGEARIGEADLQAALKQLRLALLEADVHFRVVKQFLERVEQQALGQKVLESLSPAQQVIKIVQDELTATLGGEDAKELRLDGAPAVILLAGLQGSGKTTTAGKLARRLAARRRYPLLVAADLQRAAAVDQLVQVGARVEVPVLTPQPGEKVIDLGRRAIRAARDRGHDVVIVDTAGRLHVDEALMAEIRALADAIEPDEILFVADAMTGQDAVKSAQEFARVLPLTGALLTKLDGDTRGGAALSIRAVAGVPIRFAGMGEKPEDLELFSPARMASRILGMGDVLALIERAQQTVDAKEAERLAERLTKSEFSLEDLRDQLRQLRKMGPLTQLMDMLPRMGGRQKVEVGQADEARLKRVEAIINSMTLKERRNPGLLNGSRKRRVAKGSGTSVQEINQLLKQYLQMKKMMKGVKGGFLQRAMGRMGPGPGGGPGRR